MQIGAINISSFEATYASLGTLWDKSEDLVATFRANRVVVSHRLKNYNTRSTRIMRVMLMAEGLQVTM